MWSATIWLKMHNYVFGIKYVLDVLCMKFETKTKWKSKEKETIFFTLLTRLIKLEIIDVENIWHSYYRTHGRSNEQINVNCNLLIISSRH